MCSFKLKCFFPQVLSFPDDVGPTIRNALIIQRSIERLVLVDTESQAMQLVRAQTGQQVSIAALGVCTTPINLQQCLASKCIAACHHAPASGQEALLLSHVCNSATNCLRLAA